MVSKKAKNLNQNPDCTLFPHCRCGSVFELPNTKQVIYLRLPREAFEPDTNFYVSTLKFQCNNVISGLHWKSVQGRFIGI